MKPTAAVCPKIYPIHPVAKQRQCEHHEILSVGGGDTIAG